MAEEDIAGLSREFADDQGSSLDFAPLLVDPLFGCLRRHGLRGSFKKRMTLHERRPRATHFLQYIGGLLLCECFDHAR